MAVTSQKETSISQRKTAQRGGVLSERHQHLSDFSEKNQNILKRPDPLREKGLSLSKCKKTTIKERPKPLIEKPRLRRETPLGGLGLLKSL